ncbi:MAG: TetR/AcrR family transcriptional regulator [Devosia sp.]|uniref:TetR/AcrR family transcriptional regulator n=1 Tax=Devosia sp. TaxID=1871048 RepID=UPI0024C9032A|nr:TetR/AcrR family transcriptional regulator [Devosia sp.]UYN98661.1 MAG: TetR/AcrR family transcriptional regulator [Devosia sp.]
MVKASGDRAAEKRERILVAARRLFLRQGLRATTMEAIAREAQIAKPTLYTQFADKHAVFGALLEQLIAAKHEAFLRALSAEGTISERVGRALVAKFAVISELLAGSAHADELFAAHAEGADLFARSNRFIAQALGGALAEAGLARPDQLAGLLLAAAKGVAESGITSERLGDDLMMLTARLLGPDIAAGG